MRYLIIFRNLDDVERFVSTVTNFDCDFNVYDDHQCIDGKSIMAMANLDLKKTFVLEIVTDDEDLLKEIEREIGDNIL